MGYWLKLYTDILDDPKYFKLSDKARLGMYELLLIAKKIENGEITGKLPTIEDIAFYTRRSVDEWNEILPELLTMGMVIDDGVLMLKNYTKRQDAIPNNVRIKQYRQKRNDAVMDDVTELKRDCNEPVTNRNGETETDKETDVDTEKDEDLSTPTPYSVLSQAFVNTAGIPELSGGAPKYTEAIRKLVGMGVTPEILEEAILEMREKDFTIIGPSSCINACTIVMGRKNGKTRQKNGADYTRYLKGEYGNVGV